MADPNVERRCTQVDCTGVPLSTGDRCWAHAAVPDTDAALKRLSGDGQLDARGVPITAELLERLLVAAPSDGHGHAVLTDVQFNEATFQGAAEFSGVIFQGDAQFVGAVFQGEAEFSGAIFQGGAQFGGATFQDTAWFYEATFEVTADFGGATFQDHADFDEATFQGEARFGGATFQDNAGFYAVDFQDIAWFGRASFQGGARFRGATFRGDARFLGATFHGHTWFVGATFQDHAWFDEVTFQRTRQLGPMLVRKSLVLDQAVFHERTQIEVSAAALCCQRARFLAGVQLRVRWAQVVLDDADLAAPSILTGVPDPFLGPEDDRWVRAIKRLQATGTRGARPRLIALRRADVAGLTVAGVDVRACRFAGAHHLDQLRVEESDFAYTPRGWRWTTRQTIAEEHHWRAVRPRPVGVVHRVGTLRGHDAGAINVQGDAADHADWYRPVHWPPRWLEVAPPNAGEIAGLYRALRKGREDSKDEPGAADFYYGEMEMRRHAKRAQLRRERRQGHRGTATAAAVEYAILGLYWAVSGYGLRAWRALSTLAVVVLLAGGVFALWGFAAPNAPAIHPVGVDARGAPIYAAQPAERPAGLDELSTGVRFSAQAATALLRGPDRQLTALGEWLHMALRLTGPVLLGLAVLSIRGRIKR